jgi:hypothetical protein
MGVTWIFEIIENLSKLGLDLKDERGCEIIYEEGYGWIFTDLINILQGIAIFIIFVCKPQILTHLWRRHKFLRGKSTNNITASTRLDNKATVCNNDNNKDDNVDQVEEQEQNVV